MGLFKDKDGNKKKFVQKFEQSGFGKFVKEKLPALADKVADFLPDKGGLGIIKNILDQDPKVKEEFKALTPKDQIKFWELKADFVTQMAKIEAEDRANARAREMSYLSSGKRDYMMIITGSVGLFCFLLMVYTIFYRPDLIKDNPMVAHLVGVIEGVSLTMFNYYYGTSNGSREKTVMLANQAKEKDPE